MEERYISAYFNIETIQISGGKDYVSDFSFNSITHGIELPHPDGWEPTT